MLTEDISRLCEEILSLRKMRGNLMSEMQEQAQERKQSVADLCAQMGKARVTMAQQTKSERVAFLDSLKRSVGAHLRETRNDLAGARRAWAGKAA